tara:strand:- start:2025 stop:2465 length:441 start_codon:yes stop_codon:yes gene_type:complete
MTKLLEHKHIIIRAEVNSPPKDELEACNSLAELIKKIDMKVLMGPFAKYVEMEGNRGLTVAAIIETSHIVLHSWDETDPAIIQLDVYTCGAFNPNRVFEWLQQFDVVKVDWKYIDREHGLTELNYTPKQSYSVAEIVEAMDSILSR